MLATTLSLVAVFLPVAFMGGIVGRFMESFGLTMAFAIMVSLLVSFTLTPMMAARWLKVERARQAGHSSKDSRIFHAIDAFYTRLLEWSMAHRGIVAGVAVLVLLSSVPLFMVANKNFLPLDDQAEFEINLRAAGRHEPRVDRAPREPRRQRRPAAAAGGRLHAGHGRRRPGDTRNLADHLRAAAAVEARERDQFAIMDDGAQRRSCRRSRRGLRTSVQPIATIGGGGSQNADVQFLDHRARPEEARRDRPEARRASRRVPGVVDLDTSLNVGKPELSVQIDRPKAADLGVRSATRPRHCACSSAATRSRRTTKAANSTRSTCARAPRTERPSRRSAR